MIWILFLLPVFFFVVGTAYEYGGPVAAFVVACILLATFDPDDALLITVLVWKVWLYLAWPLLAAIGFVELPIPGVDSSRSLDPQDRGRS